MMTYNTEVILYRQLRTVKTMPARFQTSGSELIILMHLVRKYM